MKPIYKNFNVSTRCPDCDGAITTFEFKNSNREFGSVIQDGFHHFNGISYQRVIYTLMRCAGCGRGGLAKIHDNGRIENGVLESFFPISIEKVKIPDNVPSGILAEYREAELCISFGAWRAGSSLLRSTLEKTLIANGYRNGPLANRIDEAAKDGIITAARCQKAHDDIRILGNDVLHEEWREIKENEVIDSHHYVQRILEDFYDDRQSVEAILKQKGKIEILKK